MSEGRPLPRTVNRERETQVEKGGALGDCLRSHFLNTFFGVRSIFYLCFGLDPIFFEK